MNIIVTMPDLEKEGYKKLIKFYKKLKETIYFKVPFLPKRTIIGEKCAIVSNGVLIGFHKIIGMRFVDKEELAKLSHGFWDEGYYIIRDGATFKEAEEKITVKGFRGFRYSDTLLKKIEVEKE